MADAIEPEFIPDSDILFCRVHRAHFNLREQRISRAVFEKPDQSVDWSNYSTKEETVARHKKPQDVKAVASITAEACRNLEQDVVHDPIAEGQPGGPNRAHSEIRGEKTKLIQSKLRDAVTAVWENPQFNTTPQ